VRAAVATAIATGRVSIGLYEAGKDTGLGPQKPNITVQNTTKPDWAIQRNGDFKTGAHAGSVNLDAFLSVNAQPN